MVTTILIVIAVVTINMHSVRIGRICLYEMIGWIESGLWRYEQSAAIGGLNQVSSGCLVIRGRWQSWWLRIGRRCLLLKPIYVNILTHVTAVAIVVVNAAKAATVTRKFRLD